MDEDTTLSLGATQVGDVDGDVLTFSVSVDYGLLQFGGTVGSSIARIDNVTALNAMLQSFAYTPPGDFTGIAKIDILVSDGQITEDGGVIVEVNEIGDVDVNDPPEIALNPTLATLPEDHDTAARLKVADIVITDDIFGVNDLRLSGADASLFELDGSEVFLVADAMLDFETNPVLDVTVEVDDASVGLDPDDYTSYAISITDTNDIPTDIGLSICTRYTSRPVGFPQRAAFRF